MYTMEGKTNACITQHYQHQQQRQQHSSLYNIKLPFPFKLHEMLDDVEAQGQESSIVSWLPHGKAFRVHQPKAFADIIMPRYFKQSKYKSFQRQLHIYGFKRISSRNRIDFGAYYHESFIRGEKEGSMLMQRQHKGGASTEDSTANITTGISKMTRNTSTTSSSSSSSFSELDPDFYKREKKNQGSSSLPLLVPCVATSSLSSSSFSSSSEHHHVPVVTAMERKNKIMVKKLDSSKRYHETTSNQDQQKTNLLKQGEKEDTTIATTISSSIPQQEQQEQLPDETRQKRQQPLITLPPLDFSTQMLLKSMFCDPAASTNSNDIDCARGSCPSPAPEPTRTPQAEDIVTRTTTTKQLDFSNAPGDDAQIRNSFPFASSLPPFLPNQSRSVNNNSNNIQYDLFREWNGRMGYDNTALVEVLRTSSLTAAATTARMAGELANSKNKHRQHFENTGVVIGLPPVEAVRTIMMEPPPVLPLVTSFPRNYFFYLNHQDNNVVLSGGSSPSSLFPPTANN